MDFKYRKARASDANAISAFTLETCRRFIFPTTSEEGRETLRELYKPSSVRKQVLANDRFVLVFGDEELVAAAAMRTDDSHIYLFFVEGNLHGQGLGRKLMDALISDTGTVRHITLNSSMYAIDFYTHLGFEATGPEFSKKGLECLPMKLSL